MKTERLIVTTRRDGRARQLIWSGSEPLALDHPTLWRLEQGARGLRIVGPEAEIPIQAESLAGGPSTVELPGDGGSHGSGLQVTVRRAGELRPAYVAGAEVASGSESRLRVSHGSRDSLLSFQEMGATLVGRAEKLKLFTLRKVKDGYRILPRVDDLKVQLGSGPAETIGRKEGRLLDAEELLRVRILWGLHWWRVTRVPVPQILVTLDRHESSEINQERAWFRMISRNLALAAAGLLMALILFLSIRDRGVSEVGNPAEPTGPIVSLKKPREFPVAIVPEAPPAAPRPAPALTHEDGVELKATPSEEKNPQVMAARITPDSTLDEDVPPPPPARALGALRHQFSAGGGGRSRHPSRKHHAGESYALGTILTSRGIAVNGDGKLSPNEVERTLAMHLDRFEGCYDSALVHNPHLSGPLLMQWVIDPHGKVHDVQIVRSRIRSPRLHQCLIQTIGRLQFSHPRGGSVLVRYPFSFSVTKI